MTDWARRKQPTSQILASVYHRPTAALPAFSAAQQEWMDEGHVRAEATLSVIVM